jgi:hypothetical protein
VYFWSKFVLGHGESTTKRLVNCCYIDVALLASSAEWDPVLKKATPVYASRREKWRTANAHLDIKKKSRELTDTFGTTAQHHHSLVTALLKWMMQRSWNWLMESTTNIVLTFMTNKQMVVFWSSRVQGAAMTTNTAQFSSKIKFSCSPAGPRTGAEHRALWWMQ